MKMFNKVLAAAAFVSASMFLTKPAQAMSIFQFDKMADQDQSEYTGDLIVGAEKVLSDKGRSDLAAQVKHLFTTRNAGDADVIGMLEFERNLAILRENDARHEIAHPNDPRLQVEDVMFSTLQKHHIDLPDNFYGIASNFQPRFPPKGASLKSPGGSGPAASTATGGPSLWDQINQQLAMPSTREVRKRDQEKADADAVAPAAPAGHRVDPPVDDHKQQQPL